MKPNTVGRDSRDSLQTHPVSPHETHAGFLSGTPILSKDGEIPVEYLSPGDRIISRDAGFARLEHISLSQRMVRAICFTAGSLGHTRPDQDLILPEFQKVLIRDWRAQALFGVSQAMVRAGDLVDDEFICDQGIRPMTLYQLHFSSYHVVYAGGMEVVGICSPTAELCPAA